MPNPIGQHNVHLADVIEVGAQGSVDEYYEPVTLLKSYTNPVVGPKHTLHVKRMYTYV